MVWYCLLSGAQGHCQSTRNHSLQDPLMPSLSHPKPSNLVFKFPPVFFGMQLINLEGPVISGEE